MSDWKEGARQFGRFVRGGSWYCGFLVAKNVEMGRAGRKSYVKNRPTNGRKVSIREFSEEAGVSQTTVSRYLKAWDKAADDGWVDPSFDLNPDDEFDLDEEENGLPPFEKYVRLVIEDEEERRRKRNNRRNNDESENEEGEEGEDEDEEDEDSSGGGSGGGGSERKTFEKEVQDRIRKAQIQLVDAFNSLTKHFRSLKLSKARREEVINQIEELEAALGSVRETLEEMK